MTVAALPRRAGRAGATGSGKEPRVRSLAPHCPWVRSSGDRRAVKAVVLQKGL